MQSSIRPRIDVLCPIHQESIQAIKNGQGKCLKCLTEGTVTIEQLTEQFQEMISQRYGKLEKLQDKSTKRLTFLKKLIVTISDQINQRMHELIDKIVQEIDQITSKVLHEQEYLRNIDISSFTLTQLIEALENLKSDKQDDCFKNIFIENQIKDQIAKSYEQTLTSFLDKKQQLHESWPAQGEYKLIFQKDSFQNCNAIATNKEMTTLINGLQNDIQVWSIGIDGTLTHQEDLTSHSHPVTCLSFSNSELFASGSQDYMVKIWAQTAAKKWNCIQTLDVHMERINDIKFSNKGDLLFTASDDKTIRLCKMMNNYAEYEETFSGTFAPIDCISLSPNNLKLVACDRDQNLSLWERENLNKEWDKKTDSLQQDPGNLFRKITFVDDKEFLAMNQDSILFRFVQNAQGNFQIVSQLALENLQDQHQGFPLTYNNQIKLAICRNGPEEVNILNKQENGFGILQKIHGNFTAGIFSSDGKSIILIEKHYGVVQIWKIEQ